MAKHTQRKKFDHPQLAHEAANGFDLIDASIPGAVKVTATVHEIDGAHWLYVVSEGDLVNGDEPVLPDYEKVG